MSARLSAPSPAFRPLLIAHRWWPLAWTILGVCVAGVTALGIVVHGAGHGTAFDTAVVGWSYRNVPHGLTTALLHLADPALTASLLVLLALGAAAMRRWSVVALVVLSPTVALGLTELVLKPFVNRRLGTLPSLQSVGVIEPYFPSGHETALASLTGVLALLVLRAPLPARVRIALTLVLLTWTLGAALGLVGHFYHYATDTIGGIAVALACVLAGALLIDRLLLARPADALSSPPGRDLPRTARGA